MTAAPTGGPSIRRLRATRTALLVASIVLLGSAMLAGAPSQPIARIDVRAGGSTSWIVTPHLAAGRQAADVALSFAVFDDARRAVTSMSVTECRTGWESFGASSSCSEQPVELMTHAPVASSVSLGRVTTIDAGGWASYLVEVVPVTTPARGDVLVLYANVTPCGAPTLADLWVVEHTRPAAQANSMGALAQCGDLPAPLLPIGTIVYSATLVVAVVARRWAWS